MRPERLATNLERDIGPSFGCEEALKMQVQESYGGAVTNTGSTALSSVRSSMGTKTSHLMVKRSFLRCPESSSHALLMKSR